MLAFGPNLKRIANLERSESIGPCLGSVDSTVHPLLTVAQERAWGVLPAEEPDRFVLRED